MPASATSLAKRKRDDLPSAILDVCSVLEAYDPVPSILNRPLPASSTDGHDKAPSAKRSKLVNGHDAPATIWQKATAEAYADYAQLIDDVDAASSDILAGQQSQSDQVQDDAPAPTLSERDQTEAAMLAFKKVLTMLVAQDLQPDGPGESANGVKPDDDERATDASHDNLPDQAPTVLTVFANVLGSRQLFSSSQKPAPTRTSSSDHLARTVRERLPLHEEQLPAGVSSMTTLSTRKQDAIPAARQNQLFSDLFKARSSLPVLTPPKPSKRAASRDSTITWVREPPNESRGGQGYTVEKLPAGQWLGYGGVSSSSGPASPEAKRKQRARTLSSGEAGQEASEHAKAAQAQAKEDALFRSVYSSFAPSTDDSDAIIPEEVKDEVWWHRYGDWHFNAMFEYPPLPDEEEPSSNGVNGQESAEDEAKAFQEAVDNFEPMLLDDATKDDGTEDQTDPDKILRQISDLLESLLSHQRIRHSSLRPNAGQPSSALSSGPAGPTAAEVQVYEDLRTKLAALVSRLPPYALAKAQGDQLSDLLVSRHILIEGPNYTGMMEDDQASRLAAAAALSTALGNQPSARSATAGRPSQATPATRTGQAYNPASSARPGLAPARPAMGGWQPPSQQYNASRTNYSQQSSYARPASGGYGARPAGGPQTNGQPAYPAARAQPTPSSGTRTGYAGYGATAGLTQPQAMYQQALQRPAGGYYPASPASQQAAAARPLYAAGAALSNGSRPQTPATPVGQGAQVQTQTQTPRGAGPAAASP